MAEKREKTSPSAAVAPLRGELPDVRWGPRGDRDSRGENDDHLGKNRWVIIYHYSVLSDVYIYIYITITITILII